MSLPGSSATLQRGHGEERSDEAISITATEIALDKGTTHCPQVRLEVMSAVLSYLWLDARHPKPGGNMHQPKHLG